MARPGAAQPRTVLSRRSRAMQERNHLRRSKWAGKPSVKLECLGKSVLPYRSAGLPSQRLHQLGLVGTRSRRLAAAAIIRTSATRDSPERPAPTVAISKTAPVRAHFSCEPFPRRHRLHLWREPGGLPDPRRRVRPSCSRILRRPSMYASFYVSRRRRDRDERDQPGQNAKWRRLHSRRAPP